MAMIGIDIIKVNRLSAIVERLGNKFLKRIFSEYEIHRASQLKCEKVRHCYFAKRFAAREAYIKAIGRYQKMSSISIRNNSLGRPLFYLKDNLTNIQVSLSDDGDYAVAVVMVPDSIIIGEGSKIGEGSESALQ